jgi:hypothetical protein
MLGRGGIMTEAVLMVSDDGAGLRIDNDKQYAMDAINQLPTSGVLITSLVPGPLLRQAGADIAHVRILADAAAFNDLPPILVQKRTLQIIDGMHRFEVAKLEGRTHITARIIDCTDDDAFILAMRSNILHGLPLTRADRIAGAKHILASHPDWSDRVVASTSGLGAKAIAAIRCESAENIQQFEKRIGRDGKRRPIRGVDGRKRAAEYFAARPDASLREAARETDVSLGTVHDVREKIRRGLDPTVGSGRSQLRSVEQSEPVDPAGHLRHVGGRSADEAPGNRVTAADGPPARRKTSGESTRGFSVIPAKLANDPTLRYSESGRVFIRWLSLHVIDVAEWRNMIEAVPDHWRNGISALADAVAEEWNEFAKELRGKMESASLVSMIHAGPGKPGRLPVDYVSGFRG